MINVLIVDDSAFMRAALSKMTENCPDIKVVATARTGVEALEKIKEYKPDVVTLDIDMPQMDGLTALKTIMRDTPMPVIMVSALTRKGAKTTLDALSLGAVDFIYKNTSRGSMNILQIEEELIAKVRAVSGKTFRRSWRMQNADSLKKPKPIKLKSLNRTDIEIIAIGTSTGGPLALEDILVQLPSDFPVPIAIVQHMPPTFTTTFADRLNSLSPLEVREAASRDALLPGRVLIAPGDFHLTVKKADPHNIVQLRKNPSDVPHRPSADILFNSVAQIYGKNAMAILLTGMGKDGAEGMKAIHEAGGPTIAQDEASCVVFGMPQAAIGMGVADRILSIVDIPKAIIEAV